jgi:hypothetical protein
MILRRGTGGDLRNFIVLGFKNLGIEVRDNATFTQLENGALSLTGFIFFNNGNGLQAPANFNGNTATMLTARATRLVESDPQLRDAFNRTAPDFRPQAGSPALNAANVSPAFANDSFFVAANYVGAFDASDDWILGWTRWVFGQ